MITPHWLTHQTVLGNTDFESATDLSNLFGALPAGAGLSSTRARSGTQSYKTPGNTGDLVGPPFKGAGFNTVLKRSCRSVCARFWIWMDSVATPGSDTFGCSTTVYDRNITTVGGWNVRRASGTSNYFIRLLDSSFALIGSEVAISSPASWNKVELLVTPTYLSLWMNDVLVATGSQTNAVEFNFFRLASCDAAWTDDVFVDDFTFAEMNARVSEGTGKISTPVALRPRLFAPGLGR